MARLLLPSHACDQIVDAQIADFQHEWARASSAPKRALIFIRGYLAFCVVFVSCAVGLRAIAPDERRALRRVFAIAVAGTLLTMTVLALAFMESIPVPAHVDPARLAEFQWFRWMLFFNNASQLLPLAASIGLACGIGMGLQRHTGRVLRRVVVITAVASGVAIFVMSSWLLPPAFRALSQVIRGQPSAGLPAASTLGDARQAMVVVEHTRTAGPGSIRGAQVGYYFRWSWPFATFVLGLLALSLNQRGRVVRIGVGIASCGGYFYLMRNVVGHLVWTSRLPPMLLAWSPNLIFVALALTIMAMSLVTRLKADTTRVRLE